MALANLTEKLYDNPNYFIRECMYSTQKRCVGGKKKRAKSKKPLEEINAFEKERVNAYKELGIPLPETILKKGDKMSKQKPTESQLRSVRKTKQLMKEYYHAFFFGTDCRFVTLTFDKLPSDFTRASVYVGKCFERLKRDGFSDGNYIAVPEYGTKEGRLHFHCIVKMKYMSNEDFAEKYWRHGFVKIEKIKREKDDPMGAKAVNYVLKYITADITMRYPNARRWLHPRGFMPKIKRTSAETSFAAYREAIHYLKSTNWKCIKKECFKSEKFGVVYKSMWVKRKRGNKNEEQPDSIVIYLDHLFFNEDYRMILLDGSNLGESKQDWALTHTDWREYYTDLTEYIYRYRNPGSAFFEECVRKYDERLANKMQELTQLPIYKTTGTPYSYKQLCEAGLLQSFDDFLIERLPRIKAA